MALLQHLARHVRRVHDCLNRERMGHVGLDRVGLCPMRNGGWIAGGGPAYTERALEREGASAVQATGPDDHPSPGGR